MRRSFCAYCAVMLLIGMSFSMYGQGTEGKNRLPGVALFQNNPGAFAAAKYDESYFVNLSFDEIPDATQRLALQKAGIQLLSYKSGTTYRAAITDQSKNTDLSNLGISNVTTIPATSKYNPALLAEDIPAHAVRPDDKVAMAIIFNQHISKTNIQQILADFDLKTIETADLSGRKIIAEVRLQQLNDLSSHPAINFVDIQQEPVSMLNHEIKTHQNINVLNSMLPGGYGLNGAGITVGVGDGGELGDHIDFDDRIINYANGSYSSFGDHGDHVSGIIGGAGHINERHQGIAPLSNIITQKTSLVTYYAEDYWNDHQMVLTNNSYGTSFLCSANGAYNYTSQTLDAQMRDLPKMLHVFAAGNSGTKTCDPYPQGYRTVLRYYQSAKNVLTVGNVNENMNLHPGSSRGPVEDGRLKPEICGIGQNVYSTGREFNYRKKGGTSMAAPAVVGTLALMNEAYRQANDSEIPDGALMKAIACNTAEDLGNPGPDYFHGFGLINGRRAVEVINQGNYSSGTISQGMSQQTPVTVAAGQEQLNILLYWPDKEADLDAPKALVNDLDLVVLDPNGNPVLPWVLNPAPEAVDQPAQRGVDTLNNIEQVTIAQPMPGTYTVVVSGTMVPTSNQVYYITHETISDDVTLTYPFGNEKLIPGEVERIRWEASPNNTTSFDISYSIDNGENWSSISTDVSADARSYNWTVPADFTEEGIIKINNSSAGNRFSQNTTPFSVEPVPANLTVEALCENMLVFNWEGDNEDFYELCYYNGSEMEALDTIRNTVFELNDSRFVSGTQYWFAVRTLDGRRSAAISAVPQQEGNCPWDFDVILKEVDVQRIGRAETSISLSDQENIELNILNQGIEAISDLVVSYQINGGTIISENVEVTIAPGDSLNYTFTQKADLLNPGLYKIDAWISSSMDSRINNDSIIGVVQARQLPNKPVSLSADNPLKEKFNAANINNYQATTTGLPGIEAWDYLTANDQSELFINQTSMSAHLIPRVERMGDDYNNQILWTLNLSEFDVNGPDILLSFEYLNDTLAPLSTPTLESNKVSIRGADQEEWQLLTTLQGSGEEWETVSDLNISEILRTTGQHFSSSFQIQFQQLNESGLAIDNVELSQLSVLPVELVDFQARQILSDVALSWETQSESNNDYFDIELAIGDEAVLRDQFTVIGQRDGNGTTNIPTYYEFMDRQPKKAGNRYYRLKQVDTDGTYSYSPLRMVSFPTDYLVEVYPNPFCSVLKLHYQSSTAKELTIQLVDSQGRIVLATKKYVAEGEQTLDIPVDQTLTEGTYYLRIPEEKMFAPKALIKIKID